MVPLKISIVTPSFNQVDFVEDTIRSVLDQRYEALEYIVVDGGSTDGSADIIQKYRGQLAHFICEPDSGHGDALNKGFRLTTGEVMGWLNSDDKYTPWTFQTVAEVFSEHPDVDWIVGHRAGWNDRGAMLPVHDTPKNAFDFLEGKYQWIQQESVFWRRRIWERAGALINDRYQFMVDGELWTRFFLCGDLWNVNAVLSGYRFHKNNRARLHHANVLGEMHEAIAAMRQRADAQTLARLQPGYPFLVYNVNESCWVKHVEPRVAGG